MTPSDYRQNLPARAPDLLVEYGEGREWRIIALAPPIAALFEISPSKATGAALRTFFAGTSPPLEELADEVAENERFLQNVQLRLGTSKAKTFTISAEPAGLSEDYRHRRVAFYFREQPL